MCSDSERIGKHVEIENLTDALAKEVQGLIGWGPTIERCVCRTILRGIVLTKRPELEGAELKRLGREIQTFLTTTAEAMPAPEGKAVWELWALGTNWKYHKPVNATQRRMSVLIILNLHYSVECWRKGREWELCLTFAEALLGD